MTDEDKSATRNRDSTAPMTKRERTARSFATAMVRMGWRSSEQRERGGDLYILPEPVAESAVRFADALFDALEAPARSRARRARRRRAPCTRKSPENPYGQRLKRQNCAHADETDILPRGQGMGLDAKADGGTPQ